MDNYFLSFFDAAANNEGVRKSLCNPITERFWFY